MLHSSAVTYTLSSDGLSDGTATLQKEEYFAIAWRSKGPGGPQIDFTGEQNLVEHAQFQIMPADATIDPELSIEEMCEAAGNFATHDEDEFHIYGVKVSVLTPDSIGLLNACLRGCAPARELIEQLIEHQTSKLRFN